MIKLYHPKKRSVREAAEDNVVRLGRLKRAGYKVGELPPLPVLKQKRVKDVPLPPTEGEDVEALEASEPVMAEHAPVEEFVEVPKKKPAAKKKVAKKAEAPVVFEIGDDGEPEEENEDE